MSKLEETAICSVPEPVHRQGQAIAAAGEVNAKRFSSWFVYRFIKRFVASGGGVGVLEDDMGAGTQCEENVVRHSVCR